MIGDGVKQNPAEAAKWYRRAADQGHADAKFRLGYCYENGQGVEKNLVEAVQWYRKAADQGHAGAQHALGFAYANGEGVQQNSAKAAKWYRKAAEQEEAEKARASVPAVKPTGVDMVRENGVLKVPVQINGAITLKFIVDSGASDVQIPKDVFLTLIRSETIKEGDFLPGQTLVLADGSNGRIDIFGC